MGDGFLREALPEVRGRIAQFKPQELGNICWGLALCQHTNASFMDAVSKTVRHQLPGWKGNDLTMALPEIVWAFAKLGIHDDKLAKKSAEQLLTCLHTVRDWNVCAMVWSLTKIQTKDSLGYFCDALSEEVNRRGFATRDVEFSSAGPQQWASKK